MELHWKEYHPNNMKNNPLDGYYAIINIKTAGKKYTILFQYPQLEDKAGCVTRKNGPELYILLEKEYDKTILGYPDPTPGHNAHNSMGDINDPGEFVRAFTSLEKAKEYAKEKCKLFIRRNNLFER